MRILVFAAVAVCASCGGTTAKDDAGTGDAGGGKCPATAPPDGTPCSPDGLECEYPGPAAFCGDVRQCHGTFLDSTTSCGAPLAPSCPATRADVQIGQACATSVVCDYSDARCGCVAPSGPVQVDGGSLTWQCTTAPSGCPAARPALGTSCTTEGQLCDYGACVFGDNPYSSPMAQTCTGGLWVRAHVPCPL